MVDSLSRIAGPIARPLRLGLVAFAIAAVGGALAFVVDYRPGNPLAYAAFALVATGVALGFVAIAWGWVAAISGTARRVPMKGDDAF